MFEDKLSSYKLVGEIPVKCTLEESVNSDRTIQTNTFGEILVSTVFLPFDHSFSDDGNPILFETLVFGGEHDGYMLRYHTYEEAIRGHDEVCYMINKLAIDRENKLNDLGV